LWGFDFGLKEEAEEESASPSALDLEGLVRRTLAVNAEIHCGTPAPGCRALSLGVADLDLPVNY